MKTQKDDLLVIGVIGRTCSGKSFLLNAMENTNVKILNLDEKLNLVIDKHFRINYYNQYGIEALEKITNPIINEIVKNEIQNTSGILLIEGIDLKHIAEYIDQYIEFNTPYNKRLSNAESKGWSRDKFNEIDKLGDRFYNDK